MDHYTIKIDDKSYEIDVEDLSESRYGVAIDGKHVEVEVASHQGDAGTDRTAPKVPTAVSNKPTGSPSPATTASGASDMTAPMPGVIAEVRVKPGDVVSKGDTMFVLEAMKMKNELHAAQAGTVQDVLVAQGDQVKYGQALLRFGEA